MPSHRINTVDDALRLVRHYGLQDWLSERSCSADGFACWLYMTTRQVSTEEVSRHLRSYQAARVAAGLDVAEFDSATAHNAEDAMRGYRYFEKEINDLMWLVRLARAERLGRMAWSAISELAAVKDRARVIDKQPQEVLVEVKRILRVLKELRLSVTPIRYVAGADPVTDNFMRADLDRLDETLSVEELWRDEEELSSPTELSALAQVVEDGSVLAVLDAKLAGVLAMPPGTEHCSVPSH